MGLEVHEFQIKCSARSGSHRIRRDPSRRHSNSTVAYCLVLKVGGANLLLYTSLIYPHLEFLVTAEDSLQSLREE